jgi:hypothetical protein
MSTQPVPTTPPSPRLLRHPAEVPFFTLMVVLNIVIVAVILRAAWVLPFLPERLQGTGWATAIRATLIGLLLYVPVLILIRETQRAAVRGSAVELSPSQFPEQFETTEDFARTLRHAGGRRSS